jgi:hypothetical protein
MKFHVRGLSGVLQGLKRGLGFSLNSCWYLVFTSRMRGVVPLLAHMCGKTVTVLSA